MVQLLRLPWLLLLAALLLPGCYALRGSAGGGQTAFAPPREIRTADVALPPGYRIEVVATGLTFPTAVAFDEQGRAYVLEAGYSYGEVWTVPRLLRVEPDGGLTVIASGENPPWNGMDYHRGAFYVAEGGQLRGGRILRIGLDGTVTALVEGLPSLGDHHTNGPAVGPDGWLYFGQGTATNSGVVGEDNFDFGWLPRYPEFHDTPCRDLTLRGENFTTRNPLSSGAREQVTTGAFVPFGTATTPGQAVRGRVPCSGAILRVRLERGAPELVAWGADFVSVRFTTDPVQFDVWRARDAVRAAGNAGSHIFAIAWGTSDYFWDVLADEIRTWHYQAGRLFVAAAGTVPACYWFEHLRPFVVFPASMQEVQQVVALNDQHALHCSSHYGGYSALAAYIPTPTSGHGSNVWGMWGASGATATIAAAAALVWSRHPNREAVLQRLRDAGSHRHNQSISIGYGVPNVYAAVGGFTSLSISAPPAAAPYTEICATAVAKGDGPFTYLWHNGVTSREQCFQMGAVGESLTISVTVRDQVENFSRTATRTISVDGGNGTCKVCD